MEFSAKQIAEFIHGKIEGDENATVNTFAKIEEGKKGAISFLSNPKYTHYLYDTESSVVLVDEALELTRQTKATLIRVSNAYESVAKLLQLYESMKPKKQGIDSMAFVSSTAKIGEGCYVGAFAYIGDNVEIGDNCQIYPHATIYDNTKIGNNCIIYPNASIYHDCRIGNNVTLHSGCVIGADGFGFAPSQDGYDKIPQIGIVVIEDDVELGANTTVDRAMMGETRISKNVKVDNLVQVAHNVQVGESSFLCAQVGIAGSSKIGKHCILAGQVGVANGLTIADNVILGAQAGVAGSIRQPGQYQGTPAFDAMNWRRSSVVMKNLPELRRDVDELKKQLKLNNR